MIRFGFRYFIWEVVLGNRSEGWGERDREGGKVERSCFIEVDVVGNGDWISFGFVEKFLNVFLNCLFGRWSDYL